MIGGQVRTQSITLVHDAQKYATMKGAERQNQGNESGGENKGKRETNIKIGFKC